MSVHPNQDYIDLLFSSKPGTPKRDVPSSQVVVTHLRTGESITLSFPYCAWTCGFVNIAAEGQAPLLWPPWDTWGHLDEEYDYPLFPDLKTSR